METFKVRHLPSYLSNSIDELKNDLIKEGHDIFNFSKAQPDAPPPNHIANALKAAIDTSQTQSYTPASQGVFGLREAICQWYYNNFNVTLDPETEVISTVGAKEGLAHLALSILNQGDVVLVPNPSYPMHAFSFLLAGADIRYIPWREETSFLKSLETAIHESWPKPKVLMINFPANPTGKTVTLKFFDKVIAIAKQHGLIVVNDFIYADYSFGRKRAPSLLQADGAKEVAVEVYSLTKSYNLSGWRVGFLCGNPHLVEALKKVKTFLDFGIFWPIQQAAIAALTGPQDCVKENRARYRKRRDTLCAGLNDIGWQVNTPDATPFVWAKLPEAFRHLGSLEFAKQLLLETRVAVSPGISYGEYGNDYVRFALVESEGRIEQAIDAMKNFINGVE